MTGARSTVVDPSPTAARTRQHTAVVALIALGVVLRWWGIWSAPPTYDETWTGAFSHLPLGSITTALRRGDPHPPLDYLLRHFLGGTGDTFALRLPSPVFACLTLGLVAWWMWDRGWFGVIVVALTSLSSFELLYSHLARMYSLAVLGGTVAAVCAERWLGDRRSRWVWCMSVALLVGLFDHASFLLLAGGLLLVPGLRRDRAAWWWRAAVVAPIAVWGLAWGPSFVDQLHGGHFDPIPLTTVSSIGDTLNGLVTRYAAMTVPVVLLLVAGAWALWRLDDTMARVAACLFAAPLVAACLIGLREHVLFSRLLAVSAWAVPVLLAAAIEEARRRPGVWGALAGGIVAVFVLASIRPSVFESDGSHPVVQTLRSVARPGDAVAVYPTYLWSLTAWTVGSPVRPTVPPQLGDLNAYVYVVPGAPFDGRVWVVEPSIYAAPIHGWPSCPAPAPHGGVYSLSCYQVPADAPDFPVRDPNAPGSPVTPSG
jgi:hypothetical protein